MRIGYGYDVHAFEPGDHVVLGGVRVPHTQGVRAHSDGDVLLHALCDALLGALGLGDIGQHFPDTDPRWKGADSRSFLRHCSRLLHEHRYRLVNADLTLLAEAPRLGNHRARDACQRGCRPRDDGGPDQRQGDDLRGPRRHRSCRGARLPRGRADRARRGRLATATGTATDAERLQLPTAFGEPPASGRLRVFTRGFPGRGDPRLRAGRHGRARNAVRREARRQHRLGRVATREGLARRGSRRRLVRAEGSQRGDPPGVHAAVAGHCAARRVPRPCGRRLSGARREPARPQAAARIAPCQSLRDSGARSRGRRQPRWRHDCNGSSSRASRTTSARNASVVPAATWRARGSGPPEAVRRATAASADSRCRPRAVPSSMPCWPRGSSRARWNRLLPGEAVMLDGKRSFFRSDGIDAELSARCAAMDVHPSGPLWGRGESPATGEALEVEAWDRGERARALRTARSTRPRARAPQPAPARSRPLVEHRRRRADALVRVAARRVRDCRAARDRARRVARRTD